MKAWLEQAWLSRYMDRDLSSEETTWFESYALDKPELLAMIETDTHLRDAVAANAPARTVQEAPGGYGAADSDLDAAQGGRNASPDVEATAPASLPRLPVTRLRTRRGAAVRPWIGVAASLLAGLGVGAFAMRALVPHGAPIALVADPTRIVYDTMRGEVAPPRIEHGDSRSPYVLIEVAVPPGAEHIVLKLGDLEEPLTPSSEGFVIFLAERKKLAVKTLASISYTRRGSSDVTTLQLQPVDQ
jgi:hypothetical protein